MIPTGLQLNSWCCLRSKGPQIATLHKTLITEDPLLAPLPDFRETRSIVIAALVVIYITTLATNTSAQSTSNIFPQFVDGVNSDGSSWSSGIYVSNLSSGVAPLRR